jgi:hypothetical protein
VRKVSRADRYKPREARVVSQWHGPFGHLRCFPDHPPTLRPPCPRLILFHRRISYRSPTTSSAALLKFGARRAEGEGPSRAERQFPRIYQPTTTSFPRGRDAAFSTCARATPRDSRKPPHLRRVRLLRLSRGCPVAVPRLSHLHFSDARTLVTLVTLDTRTQKGRQSLGSLTYIDNVSPARPATNTSANNKFTPKVTKETLRGFYNIQATDNLATLNSSVKSFSSSSFYFFFLSPSPPPQPVALQLAFSPRTS